MVLKLVLKGYVLSASYIWSCCENCFSIHADRTHFVYSSTYFCLSPCADIREWCGCIVNEPPGYTLVLLLCSVSSMFLIGAYDVNYRKFVCRYKFGLIRRIVGCYWMKVKVKVSISFGISYGKSWAMSARYFLLWCGYSSLNSLQDLYDNKTLFPYLTCNHKSLRCDVTHLTEICIRQFIHFLFLFLSISWLFLLFSKIWFLMMTLSLVLCACKNTFAPAVSLNSFYANTFHINFSDG